LPETIQLLERTVEFTWQTLERSPWKLLQRFGENAPAPLLVNTSFNLFGEPLVIAPRDAVSSYFCSGTDALVAGNFVLSKS
jgi:carbamoyltransferase